MCLTAISDGKGVPPSYSGRRIPVKSVSVLQIIGSPISCPLSVILLAKGIRPALKKGVL